MSVFPAEYFSYETRYPESGSRIQLGRSYQLSYPSHAPDQRTFLLTLQGMAYFTDAAGAADYITEPERNMWVLEQFYIVHRLHQSFDLPHPIHGTVVCKFNTPLKVPSGIVGGNGLLPSFDVELIEIP